MNSLKATSSGQPAPQRVTRAAGFAVELLTTGACTPRLHLLHLSERREAALSLEVSSMFGSPSTLIGLVALVVTALTASFSTLPGRRRARLEESRKNP